MTKDKVKLTALHKINFVKELLDFLKEGFQDPIQIIRYLQSRNKCKNPKCETETCKPLLPYCLRKKGQSPWSRNMFKAFDRSRQEWYKPGHQYYEEPINAFFTLPRIAQFLERKLPKNDISNIFQMEFKGGGAYKFFVPNCLWKGKEPVKIFNDNGIGMCCDFYIKDHTKKIPNFVGEIKIAVPFHENDILAEFQSDIEKCREWLKPETKPYIEERFNTNFEYALAILIDLTGRKTYVDKWNVEMKKLEARYLKERIFVRLIHIS